MFIMAELPHALYSLPSMCNYRSQIPVATYLSGFVSAASITRSFGGVHPTGQWMSLQLWQQLLPMGLQKGVAVQDIARLFLGKEETKSQF